MQRAIRVVTTVVIFLVLIVGVAILSLRQPTFSGVDFVGGPRAEAARLRAHVEFLAVESMPRNHNNPEKLSAAAEYVKAGLSVPGARVSVQPYFAEVGRTGGTEQVNVIARFGPESGRVIVVGAHYDAFGDLPGADDNASGVAGLLELARLLSLRDVSERIELVAFATEEPPFFGSTQMGSAVHALEMIEGEVDLKAMICLEMIGYFVEKQEYPSWALRLAYPSNGLFAAVIGRWEDRGLAKAVKRCFNGSSDLQTISYSGPRLFGSDLSDHRNYWEHGYPAVMITDTAFLRNPNYHTAGDTPDTLDYERMAKVVDGVLNSVLFLSKAE